MIVSIITASFNNRETIEQCIKSVYRQSYEKIEHIIIDGGSSDGTVEVIKSHAHNNTNWISERDKGIYHALNKGLKMATGDIVGFLHADDMYTNHYVIDLVVSRIMNCDVDSCYGDLLYVSRKNTEKIVRYWKSCPYEEGLFRKGWMPPHPTFFVRKDVYKKYGDFNTDFRISADYEIMLRLLEKKRISSHYIPEVLIKMRMGGASNKNFQNILRKTTEDYRAWKVNNLGSSSYAILLKNLSKVPQFFKRL